MSNPTQPQGFPQQPGQGQPGQYPTPGQYMAPPPPPKKKRGKWIVLGIIGVVVIIIFGSCVSSLVNNASAPTPGVVVTESTDDTPTSKAPTKEASKPAVPPKEAEPYTIKATACERGDYGQVEIKVKVTNNTDEKRTYIFDIAVEDDDGNTVGSGFGSIGNVKAGKTGTASTFASMSDEDYDGKITCVIDVTNFSEAN